MKCISITAILKKKEKDLIKCVYSVKINLQITNKINVYYNKYAICQPITLIPLTILVILHCLAIISLLVIVICLSLLCVIKYAYGIRKVVIEKEHVQNLGTICWFLCRFIFCEGCFGDNQLFFLPKLNDWS